MTIEDLINRSKIELEGKVFDIQKSVKSNPYNFVRNPLTSAHETAQYVYFIETTDGIKMVDFPESSEERQFSSDLQFLEWRRRMIGSLVRYTRIPSKFFPGDREYGINYKLDVLEGELKGTYEESVWWVI